MVTCCEFKQTDLISNLFDIKNPGEYPRSAFVCLEDLVPQGHLLRKIQKHMDFSFILEKVKPYYCEDNGRPPVDPVMLLR